MRFVCDCAGEEGEMKIDIVLFDVSSVPLFHGHHYTKACSATPIIFSGDISSI